MKTRVNYSYSQLDALTGGLQQGELILIGGSPGMGKTAFALNLVHNFAAQNHAVLYLTVDDYRHFPAHRLLYISANLRESLSADREYWEKLASATTTLSKSGSILEQLNTRLIKDEHKLFSAIWEKLTAFKFPKILIVDGFHYKHASTYNGFWNSLRNLARHFSIPVLVLISSSLSCENRKNKRPILEDFSFAEDFDTVLFIYRDAYYNFLLDNLEGEPAEIIVAKSLNRRTGTCSLHYTWNNGRLDNIN